MSSDVHERNSAEGIPEANFGRNTDSLGCLAL